MLLNFWGSAWHRYAVGHLILRNVPRIYGTETVTWPLGNVRTIKRANGPSSSSDVVEGMGDGLLLRIIDMLPW